MNFTHPTNLRLLARNEGKIKSYESCCDVRAWSHDVRTKDHHLREWMKADMPVCVIPASTLVSFLKTMTFRSRRRATPRCHPDCKSKVLLESICTSCHAVNACLKSDETFETYFVEEELETSHWPCDKCLEALKSIKMFWKIIIDRIFNIKIPKFEEFEPKCGSTDSVRSVVKTWQAEIIQQALFVKSISQELSTASLFKTNNSNMDVNAVSSKMTIKTCPIKTGVCPKCARSYISHIVRSRDVKISDKRSLYNKLTKSTSVRTRMIDVGCDTCFVEVENEEIKAYKRNIEVLQVKCNNQDNEMERLRRDNNSLKIELDNVYKSCPWKASVYSPDSMDVENRFVTLIPKPFEANLEDPVKSIDSEMIITMKNCKNQSFKHVSLLQVLHKTNEPVIEDIHEPYCKKDDPMEILTKVQNTFGAIVRREMNIVNEKKHKPKKTDVDATFHRISTSRSAPSCSTLSSRFSSELDFVSSKDVSEKNNVRVTNI